MVARAKRDVVFGSDGGGRGGGGRWRVVGGFVGVVRGVRGRRGTGRGAATGGTRRCSGGSGGGGVVLEGGETLHEGAEGLAALVMLAFGVGCACREKLAGLRDTEEIKLTSSSRDGMAGHISSHHGGSWAVGHGLAMSGVTGRDPAVEIAL